MSAEGDAIKPLGRCIKEEMNRMGDALYAHEKLGQAIHHLSLGKGRINERLIAACTYGFVHVHRDALPHAEMKQYYDKIWSAVTRVADEKRGSFAASIERMTEDQACEIAQAIESLDSMLGVHIDHGSEAD